VGTGVLTFDEAKHEYRVDGRVVPSVTQILKRVFPDVYSGIPAHILDRKARLGTAVHKTIELELAGRLDYTTIHAEVQPYFESWLQWWESLANKSTLGSERRIHCEAGGYCGAIDWDGEIDGSLWTIDWKITNHRMPTHRLQIAGGYAFGYRPENRAGGLYLKADGSIAELVEYDVKKTLPDWLSVLRVHKLMEQMQ
jgi:hypothetical protein